jgi:hypothetical protein
VEVEINAADRKLPREVRKQFIEVDSHLTDLINAPPGGLRKEVTVLVNLWNSIWDMRGKLSVSRGGLRSRAESIGVGFATENYVKLREWGLDKKTANAARLLVMNPQIAADAAEAFADYWAGLRKYSREQAEIRSGYIRVMDEAFKVLRVQPARTLIRGEDTLRFSDKVTIRGRFEPEAASSEP